MDPLDLQRSAAGGLSFRRRPAGSRRPERRQHGAALRRAQPVDYLGAGDVLRRRRQRAPLHQAGGSRRSALPSGPQRRSLHHRQRQPAAQSARHHRPSAPGGAGHRARQSGRIRTEGNLCRRGVAAGRPFHRRKGSGADALRRPEAPKRHAGHHHLHQRHHRRSQGRLPDAPQLHGQRGAVSLAHADRRHLAHADHSAAGPLFRPRLRLLLHHGARRLMRYRSGGPYADGNAQKHSRQHPGDCARLHPLRARSGQEFQEEHRDRHSEAGQAGRASV